MGTTSPHDRRALRRAVELPCTLLSSIWTSPSELRARDLTNDGIWIDTERPLAPGSEVVLTFVPPGDSREVIVVGQVRRSNEGNISGMGIAFTGITERDRQRLARAISGRPPPLRRAMRGTHRELAQVSMITDREERFDDQVNVYRTVSATPAILERDL